MDGGTDGRLCDRKDCVYTMQRGKNVKTSLQLCCKPGTCPDVNDDNDANNDNKDDDHYEDADDNNRCFCT